MALDQQTLGARLQRARQVANVSLEAAAHHIQQNPSWLQAVESGSDRITLDKVLQLAEYYELDVSDVIEGKTTGREITARFRAEGHETTAEQERELRQTLKMVETLAFLLDILGESLGPFPSDIIVGEPHSWIEARSQGETCAAALREEAELHDAPLEAINNLELIAKCFVLETTLPASVSGISMEPEVGTPIIIVPAHEMGERKRFSILHELAHHLFDPIHSPMVSTHFSKRLIETRADAFAGALLLPQRSIEEFAEKRGKTPASLHFADVADLSVLYGTSFDCAAYRLYLGQWITRQDFEEMRDRAVHARGRRRKVGVELGKLWESERWPRLRTTALRKAAHAYKMDLITEERFLEYAATFGFADEAYNSMLGGLIADN